jgi:hypothetical protein
MYGDDTVCGTDNPIAFRKLHHLLLMHFMVRQKAANALGQQQTVSIERYLLERLRNPFPISRRTCLGSDRLGPARPRGDPTPTGLSASRASRSCELSPRTPTVHRRFACS